MSEMTQALVASAITMTGDEVRNLDDVVLGKVEDFMIDLERGAIAYAVVSFTSTGGSGEKLFAVPWGALTLDDGCHCFRLDTPAERLEGAPGFDKHEWPDTADTSWLGTVYDFYGVQRYW